MSDLPATARRLIDELQLSPHPEGGWYRRIHTGTVPVTRPDGESRPGITLIHYLLPAGAFSAWHRVDGDEIWHYLDGEALDLWQITADRARCERLGPLPNARPVQVVPAGTWQAAAPAGAWTLAACAVGPGFAFHGFELLRDHAGVADWVRRHAPEQAGLL